MWSAGVRSGHCVDTPLANHLHWLRELFQFVAAVSVGGSICFIYLCMCVQKTDPSEYSRRPEWSGS